MTGKEVPFGYRYNGGQVFVKLRLLANNFFKFGIEKYGEYRHTASGYVIFEASFNTRSADYAELNRKLDSMRYASKTVTDKPTNQEELPF